VSRLPLLLSVFAANPRSLRGARGPPAGTPLSARVLADALRVPSRSALGSRKMLRGRRLAVIGDPCAAAAACALAEFSTCRSAGFREGAGPDGAAAAASAAAVAALKTLEALLGHSDAPGETSPATDRALTVFAGKSTILAQSARGAPSSIWADGTHDDALAKMAHAADAVLAFVPRGAEPRAAEILGGALRVGTALVIVSPGMLHADAEVGTARLVAQLTDPVLGHVSIIAA
jgi:hypothetical protein